MPLALGYDPVRARAARAELRQSGLFASMKAVDQPIPLAKSLGCHRRRHLEQGNAGTCWLHAPTQHAEIYANAKHLDSFDVCRRLVGYAGKLLEGGGNPTNGGAPIDAYRAMTSNGAGIAHEVLWPYTDDAVELAKPPPLSVRADGHDQSFVAPVIVEDLDEAKRLIAINHPVSVGIDWSDLWDTVGATAFDQAGPTIGGHALLLIGYVGPSVWSKDEWFQLDNWHGRTRYRRLSDQLARYVPGYGEPLNTGKGAGYTSDFWVRGDCLRAVVSNGGDLSSATDLLPIQHFSMTAELLKLLSRILHTER